MDLIKLANARTLIEAGAARGALVIGQPGGYVIVLRVGMRDLTLATKSGEPRVFQTLDTTARTLRELGMANRIELDLANYSPPGPLTRRRRPDRARALRQKQPPSEA